jgi:hypothetical protein
MIYGARQSASSLDEQFECLILKGIGMDADGAKPCSDVVTGLGRLEPRKSQSKAKPSREIKARLIPICSRGSSESSPTSSRLNGGRVSARAQVNKGVRTRNGKYSVNGILSVSCGHP